MLRPDRRSWLGLVTLAAVAGLVAEADAHYCSNIFATPARLVVTPEQNTVNVSSAGTQLKVYLRNNFPYRMFAVKMRGVATGYTINVTPSSTVGQNIYPGQDAVYLFTISGPAGSVSVSTLNLQVSFRVTTPTTWRTSTDCIVNQNPSSAILIAGAQGQTTCSLGNQVPSLSAATLADKAGSTPISSAAPFFNRTGLQQMIHWFGYRFCYNGWNGSWRCGTQDCPSPCAEGSAWTYLDGYSFPWSVIHAGMEVGARKPFLGSELTNARNAAANALKGGGSPEHKCAAAVLGGYLWQGATSTTTFTSALSLSTNSVPAICQNAGLRTLNGTPTSTCASGQYYERAACAAAEGIRGNDSAVNSVLKPNAGDGNNTGSTQGIYYATLLYMVAKIRKNQSGWISFYSDGGAPPPDTQVKVDQRKPDSKVAPKADGQPAKLDGQPPKTDGQVATHDGLPQTDGQASTSDGTTSGDHGGATGDGSGGKDDEGCSCALGREPLPAPILWLSGLALALGTLLLRRRRSR